MGVSDLFGAQQRGSVQQQAEFGVSLRGGAAAEGGADGEEEEEEARGGEHLHHLSVCVSVCLRLGGSAGSDPGEELLRSLADVTAHS